MDLIEVLDEKYLPRNGSKLVYVNKRPLVLFNFNGKITALGSVCLRKGGPLDEAK
jgi:nitrite reductase/ring-hydroxylating ferredoxin subunit